MINRDTINHWNKTQFPTYDKIINNGFTNGDLLSFSKEDYSLESFANKDYTIKNYGFGCPISLELLKIIAKSKKIIEVGAGTGWLSLALSKLGIDIIATDNYSWNNKFKETIFPVKKMLASRAVNLHPNRDVLVCWPDYANEWAYRMATNINSNRMLYYIGEGDGGCTADSKFHNYVNKKFKEIEHNLPYPNWFGLHTSLFVYRKL